VHGTAWRDNGTFGIRHLQTILSFSLIWGGSLVGDNLLFSPSMCTHPHTYHHPTAYPAPFVPMTPYLGLGAPPHLPSTHAFGPTLGTSPSQDLASTTLPIPTHPPTCTYPCQNARRRGAPGAGCLRSLVLPSASHSQLPGRPFPQPLRCHTGHCGQFSCPTPAGACPSSELHAHLRPIACWLPVPSRATTSSPPSPMARHSSPPSSA